MKRIVLSILIICLVFCSQPALASAMTYDEAVDQLVADGYTRDAEGYLAEPRAGTRCSASAWQAPGPSTMRRTSCATSCRPWASRTSASRRSPWTPGTSRVRRSPSGGTTYTASSFAGVRGTDGPLNAEMVYVGNGTAAEFAAAGDVNGKIVDAAGELGVRRGAGREATLRGAVGALVRTPGADSFRWCSYPEALGANNGEYRHPRWVPMVYVSWKDGDAIEAKLAAKGHVMATMASDVTFTMAENGGVGYNIIGVLPGSDPDLAPVLLASHLDAHFRAPDWTTRVPPSTNC